MGERWIWVVMPSANRAGGRRTNAWRFVMTPLWRAPIPAAARPPY
jgi:hypothetical protein